MRRAIGIFAVCLLASLAAGAQVVPAAAASSGSLFAFVQPSTVAKLDPTTGAITTLADLALPGQSPLFSNLVADPSNHRLFVIRSVFTPGSPPSSQLLAIDTRSAAVSVGPSLSESVFDLVFDTSSEILFGQDTACCPFHEVRIDVTTGAVTNIADLPGVQPLFSTIDSSTHTIYKATESFVLGQFQPVVQMLAINAITGVVVSSPPLTTGVFSVAFDSSTRELFGKTFCCPIALVRVDPATGAEAAVGSYDFGTAFGPTITVDPATHTVYATEDHPFPKAELADIDTIDATTGALISRVFTTPGMSSIVFVGTLITPESIKTDVSTALAGGAIDNAGVANSLLAKLDAASAARSAGNCTDAAAIYQAFVNVLDAQSGKHVAIATADQLISEAQFLIANCP